MITRSLVASNRWSIEYFLFTLILKCLKGVHVQLCVHVIFYCWFTSHLQTAVALDPEKKMKERKKKRKKLKQNVVKEHEDECYRCGEGGELVMCDKSHCPKVYHLKCLKLAKLPTG